jgi:hypothetical protein
VDGSEAVNSAHNFASLGGIFGTPFSTVDQTNLQNNDKTEDDSSASNVGEKHAVLFDPVSSDQVTQLRNSETKDDSHQLLYF